MVNVEISDEMTQRIEQSHYLVAYLAKLHHEHSTEESFTVPVTIRKDDVSGFVIDVDGHEVKFSA
jgi:hypothetical protein